MGTRTVLPRGGAAGASEGWWAALLFQGKRVLRCAGSPEALRVPPPRSCGTLLRWAVAKWGL